MKRPCPWCGRHIATNKDGMLRVHLFANRNGQVLTHKCGGSGEHPYGPAAVSHSTA